MIRLCGRWGFDVERAWKMTPGEFEVLVDGGLAREREARLLTARVESVLMATLGSVKVSPLVIIGEEDDFGANPFGEPTDEEKKAAYDADLERKARASHRRWMPPGIVPADADEEGS